MDKVNDLGIRHVMSCTSDSTHTISKYHPTRTPDIQLGSEVCMSNPESESEPSIQNADQRLEEEK
jgi:hypothetical protein